VDNLRGTHNASPVAATLLGGSLARPRDSPQLCRVAANTWNKQPRANDKGWSSSLGVGRGLKTPHHLLLAGLCFSAVQALAWSWHLFLGDKVWSAQQGGVGVTLRFALIKTYGSSDGRVKGHLARAALKAKDSTTRGLPTPSHPTLTVAQRRGIRRSRTLRPGNSSSIWGTCLHLVT
jgi:hypothetical protein